MQALPVISPSAATSNSDINESKSSTLPSRHSTLSETNDIGILQQILPALDAGTLRHSSVDLPDRPRASIEPFRVIYLCFHL